VTKVWVNGELFDPGEARISVFDHGLLVGDGVFETVKIAGGVPFALTRHLKRLARSAAGLGLRTPDTDAIRTGAAAVVASSPGWDLGRIRITYTSGTGPLGSDRGDEGSLAVVAASEQMPFPSTADVAVVPWPRNERGALSGLKTTSYGENAKALQYAHEHGGGEAIFGNLAGQLCEGTGSNVFLVREGRLLTPALRSGCLAGITRELVIEWLGAEETDIPLADFTSFDEAFLVSTTRDVQPIRAVDGAAFPSAPGPVTAKAMEVFRERSAADIDP
jgi:branched-chain amino acid aminotransferase